MPAYGAPFHGHDVLQTRRDGDEDHQELMVQITNATRQNSSVDERNVGAHCRYGLCVVAKGRQELRLNRVYRGNVT